MANAIIKSSITTMDVLVIFLICGVDQSEMFMVAGNLVGGGRDQPYIVHSTSMLIMTIIGITLINGLDKQC
jgi:hypothetical protein